MLEWIVATTVIANIGIVVLKCTNFKRASCPHWPECGCKNPPHDEDDNFIHWGHGLMAWFAVWVIVIVLHVRSVIDALVFKIAANP